MYNREQQLRKQLEQIRRAGAQEISEFDFETKGLSPDISRAAKKITAELNKLEQTGQYPQERDRYYYYKQTENDAARSAQFADEQKGFIERAVKDAIEGVGLSLAAMTIGVIFNGTPETQRVNAIYESMADRRAQEGEAWRLQGPEFEEKIKKSIREQLREQKKRR